MQTAQHHESKATRVYLVTGPHLSEHCTTQRVEAISALSAWMSVAQHYAETHGLSVVNCKSKFTVREAK